MITRRPIFSKLIPFWCLIFAGHLYAESVAIQVKNTAPIFDTDQLKDAIEGEKYTE